MDSFRSYNISTLPLSKEGILHQLALASSTGVLAASGFFWLPLNNDPWGRLLHVI